MRLTRIHHCYMMISNAWLVCTVWDLETCTGTEITPIPTRSRRLCFHPHRSRDLHRYGDDRNPADSVGFPRGCLFVCLCMSVCVFRSITALWGQYICCLSVCLCVSIYVCLSVCVCRSITAIRGRYICCGAHSCVYCRCFFCAADTPRSVTYLLTYLLLSALLSVSHISVINVYKCLLFSWIPRLQTFLIFERLLF